RNTHISELIKYITRAEDAIVVNNNAAAVMLVLKTFAARKEVIISRGELIEIGGSFRIPEIMKASGAKMVEVGTTNRTRLSDYEDAITDKTRMILKAHKSNYFISGFTEEVEINDLVKLAKRYDLMCVYDMGSGLLRKPEGLPIEKEPDVRSALEAGVDIVTFSGDKLLGGPQAGIITGKKEYISKLAKAPLMRTLRVGKMTIAALTAVMRCYLKDEDLLPGIPIFKMLSRDKEELQRLAKQLSNEFDKYKVKNKIIESPAQVGGGSLPQLSIDSLAVMIVPPKADRKFARRVFIELLKLDKPILGILREGNLLFDVLTIFEEDFSFIAKAVNSIMSKK
ncbi:MAG: L-seryl-tRNA(Sec) selenium transferase, partial [Candidatus Cloacimonetes bacterium]|nr:L-seryl-tRNA(Sec) selenium transferase [Candidatus Cloacimonadota bacterium]